MALQVVPQDGKLIGADEQAASVTGGQQGSLLALITGEVTEPFRATVDRCE
jgi:hypothetical protein